VGQRGTGGPGSAEVPQSIQQLSSSFVSDEPCNARLVLTIEPLELLQRPLPLTRENKRMRPSVVDGGKPLNPSTSFKLIQHLRYPCAFDVQRLPDLCLRARWTCSRRRK
jgi:hypothetical protein